MVHIVINDIFNQAYELTDRYNAPRSSAAQRHRYDAYFTFSLVTRLPVTPQQWLHILNRALGRLPDFHSNHPGEVYQAVAESVMRGDLAIYQLPRITDFGALRGKQGVGLRFIKGPNPHCATHLTPEICNSPAAAKQLLDELGISDKAFLGYLNGESLYNSYQQQNPLQDALNLLATGKLLAYKVTLPASAPAAKPVEYLPTTAADKPVPLAPETNKSSTSSSTEKLGKVNAAPAEDAAPFKRAHKDGKAEDPYTLQANGKPLGAQEGAMPKACKGLSRLPENHGLLVEQGYPDLHCEWKPGRFATDYANFSDARPDVLPPGTKLYRILDEQANPAGAYWATALPESKAGWRGNYAVKDSWNDNGYYTEYTVPPGDGLKVWRGTTAGQKYEVSDGKKFYLEGGKEQIFVSPNTVAPAPKKFTPWTDARS